jgi:uncharacterized membrane protein
MSDLPARPRTSGFAPNAAGALAYVLGPLTGVAFLLIEKEDRFVRFHAAQSVVVGIALIAASITFSVLTSILGAIPFLGWLLSALLTMVFGVASLVLWLMLMYRAFQGEEWEVPGVGTHARRLLAPPSPDPGG